MNNLKLSLIAPLILIVFSTACNCTTPDGSLSIQQTKGPSQIPQIDNGHYTIIGAGYPLSTDQVTINFSKIPSNGGVTPISGTYNVNVTRGKFSWDFIIKSYDIFSQNKTYPDVLITGLDKTSKCLAPSLTLSAFHWDARHSTEL